MGRRIQAAQFLNESSRVITLFSAQCRAAFVDAAPGYDERRIASGRAVRQWRDGIDQEAVAVLPQCEAQVATALKVVRCRLFFGEPTASRRLKIGLSSVKLYMLSVRIALTLLLPHPSRIPGRILPLTW